jgi:type IV secretory pathway VirB2 component (pilin)
MKNKHRKAAFLPLFLLAAVKAAAQSTLLPPGMNTLMTSILGVFTGTFVKTILIVCLCGCAVAYGFNKDNEKMKRNIIAIGVAVAILCTASFIVNAIWDASAS